MGSGRGLDELARELAAGRISRRAALGRLAGGAAGLAIASIPGAEALGFTGSKRCPKSRRCDGKCCPNHAHCKHGKCTCDGGYTKCGRKCVDLQASPKNCGDCGHACVEGETCEAGECVSTASPMAPSNNLAEAGLTCASSTTTDLAVNQPASINTDTDCTAVVPQSGASDLCAVLRRNVSVASGATLTVIGSRPLAILATNNITLDGTIGAAAKGATAGPGSAPVTANGADGSSTARNGGGGGGHGTAGAAGATTGTPPTGAGGGAAAGSAAVIPLLGGGHGGHNLDSSPNVGGGGGGGVQLSACHGLSVGSTGHIDVGGGGGQGGQGHPSAAAGGGAGGGAGGSVLLESPQVTLTAGAVIAANGGGGGGGGDTGASVAGSPGQDGPMSVAPAAGGLAAGGSAGPGGSGGAGASAPNPGSPPSGGTDGGGGGGGAVGRIRINTGDGQAPDTSGVVISPAPTTGAIATA
jgi:hypothetical protein